MAGEIGGTLSGGLQGAGAGATTGAMLGGPPGAAIGAGIGAGVGMFAGYQQASAQSELGALTDKQIKYQREQDRKMLLMKMMEIDRQKRLDAFRMKQTAEQMRLNRNTQGIKGMEIAGQAFSALRDRGYQLAEINKFKNYRSFNNG